MKQRLPIALFSLRVSVFVVMVVWTLDKFLNTPHATAVYEHFYSIKGVPLSVFYGIATVELLILIGFVLGIQKKWTYGLVLLFHAVSTLSSFQQYLAPFNGSNILFFAAWPMLAACFSLYILRQEDTLWTFGRA